MFYNTHYIELFKQQNHTHVCSIMKQYMNKLTLHIINKLAKKHFHVITCKGFKQDS